MAELKGETKVRFVASMFARISRRYDVLNTIMTGGMHHRLEFFVRNNVSLPLADGEFGCYRSLFEDSARIQAAMYVRTIVAVHTMDQVQWLAPTFVGGDYDYTTAAGNRRTGNRGQHAAYLAYRTAADFLEGATFEGTLSLGSNIAAYRFHQPSGRKVIVLWDPKNRQVKLPDVDQTWKVFDMLGRPVTWPPEDKLSLSVFPLYCVESRR